MIYFSGSRYPLTFLSVTLWTLKNVSAWSTCSVMIMTFSIVSQQLFALADVCWWDANLQQRVQREAFCACAGLKTTKIVFGLEPRWGSSWLSPDSLVGWGGKYLLPIPFPSTTTASWPPAYPGSLRFSLMVRGWMKHWLQRHYATPRQVSDIPWTVLFGVAFVKVTVPQI